LQLAAVNNTVVFLLESVVFGLMDCSFRRWCASSPTWTPPGRYRRSPSPPP